MNQTTNNQAVNVIPSASVIFIVSFISSDNPEFERYEGSNYRDEYGGLVECVKLCSEPSIIRAFKSYEDADSFIKAESFQIPIQLGIKRAIDALMVAWNNDNPYPDYDAFGSALEQMKSNWENDKDAELTHLYFLFKYDVSIEKMMGEYFRFSIEEIPFGLSNNESE